MPGVQALSLITREGLPVASVQITTVDDALLSAMSATIHAVSGKAVTELESGNLEAIIIQVSHPTFTVINSKYEGGAR
ncbi:MAG: roadblock/LC7 domain-containing protein, partial [Candidatus Hodarchaeota archaeon]